VVQPGRKRREDSPYAERSRRLSAWLRSLREGAGLSQEELARRADVTLATLRKLEAGKIVNPGHFIIMALLGALGARPEDLSSYASPADTDDEQLRYVMTKLAGRGGSWNTSWNHKPAQPGTFRDLRAIPRDVCPVK
jgi:transcriptional regulator with XRE-family HTH domain